MTLPQKKYDERQIALRGKAYKYAFFTMITCSVIIMIIETLEQMPIFFSCPVTADLMIFIAILAGLIVFATYAIMQDAYFRLDNNKPLLLVCYILLTVINYVIGIAIRMNESPNEPFSLINTGNLAGGIAMTVLLIILVIKVIRDRKED